MAQKEKDYRREDNEDYYLKNKDLKRQLKVNVRHSMYLSQAFPIITKPKRLGLYTVTTERKFNNNIEHLPYYVEPQPNDFPLDLNTGYEQAIKKPESAYDEYLNHLLQYICHNKDALLIEVENRKRLRFNFVCYRGVLRSIMCTPYHRDEWVLYAIKYRGTVYLVKRETPKQLHERLNREEKYEKMCSWGFKFEQYCVSNDPATKPVTNQPVDECAEVGCVFETKLCGLNLLYAAEMDAVISSDVIDTKAKIDLEKINFIELKTRQANLSEGQKATYLRHKTRQWWGQAFLANIDQVYVGMRTPEGLVEYIEKMKVRDICKAGEKWWSASTVTHFLQRFLHTVERTLVYDDPTIVVQLDYNLKYGGITYKYLDESNAFLPDWYTSIFEKSENVGD